jgi:drug/metabolite transporter (DMT)-like permease
MTASIVAALAAATSFAWAAVYQQEAAQRAPAGDSLKLRLLLDLLHRPRWIAGIALLVCGYALQGVALAFGPVALVQPVVVTELAIAVPIAMWRRHRRAAARDWAGIIAVLGGVAGFLTLASPVEGIGNPAPLTWVATLTPVAAVTALLVTVATRASGRHRAMLLGAAAGAAFGLLAVLTKATVSELARSLTGALTSPQPYLLILAGIVALVISQSAYQAGPLAYSMPFIAVLEPLLAVLVGDTALNEQVRLTGAPLAGEALTAVLAAIGIVLLATSPTVLSIYDDTR